MQNFMLLAFTTAEESVTIQTKNKQVCQQACKTHTPPYGLSRRHRPQFRALVHAATDVTPARRQQMRSSAGATAATEHTTRTQAGWGFAALSTFFVPGDLDQ